ncbi:MAG: cupin domain-containing protein [Caulobacterales bacterium]
MVPYAAFQAGVEAAAGRFFVGVRHGTMFTLLYSPRGEDPQTPHAQDEIYIVHAGAAVFRKGEETSRVAAGDVIFVEANAEHRFEAFSDDFAVFAVFWGPEGGEDPR